jgi:hypothetical protein
VTAPDRTIWWDAPAVTAAALAVLRLTDGDVDAGRVAAHVDPAGQIINQRLDRDPVDAFTSATVPAEVAAAHVTVVVNLYRAKDQPAASIDGMMLGAVPPSYVDPLAGVRTLIDPHRMRRGMG